MADNINNVAPTDRDNTAGWIIALIIVLAIVVAAFLWFRNSPGVPNTGTDNTNITVPIDTGGSSAAPGDATGGAGGPTGGSATGGTTY